MTIASILLAPLAINAVGQAVNSVKNIFTGNKTGKTTEDTVELSRKNDSNSKEYFKRMIGNDWKPSDPISLAKLKAAFSAGITSLKEKLAELMENAGIPLNPGFEITIDASGKIIIDGERTDCDKIQALFENDEDLQQSVIDSLDRQSLIHSIKSSKSKNPYDTMKQPPTSLSIHFK